MDHGFMTLDQAAAHLHMDARELKHFAQREEVPSQKRGDDFFFEHRLLDEWAQRRMIDLSPKQLTGEHLQEMDERKKASAAELRIATLIPEGAIQLELSAKNRGGVLRDMTELAESTGLVYDKDALFQGLVAREEAASTAVGGGAAFLHARFHDPYIFQETFVAIGRTSRPVFFGAQDGEGTDVFFLICCTDHALHLHILARLCLLAHGTTLLADMRAAPDAESVREILTAAENGLLGSLRRG